MIPHSKALRICGLWFALAVTPAASLAHGLLKSSFPADKAHTAPPRELRLVFTERPELSLSRVVLLRSGRDTVALGPMTVTDVNLTVPIVGPVTSGTYTVAWTTVGKDGHPVSGKFSFTVHGAEDDSASVAGDTVRAGVDSTRAHHDTLLMPTSANRFDAQSTGYVIVRFALYAALLVVIGVVAFRFVVLGFLNPDTIPGFADDAARRAATLGVFAASALFVACLGRLLAQSLALGAANLAESQQVGGLLFGTTWGRGWLAQLSASAVAIVAMRSARRSTVRGLGPAWTIAGLTALVLAFTPAFASHAASVPERASLAILADGLHVVGAAGWLGSLFVVLAAGIPAAMAVSATHRGAAIVRLFNAFSPAAIAFAALVGATGLFAAWLHVGAVSALWATSYGRLLAAKLAILSIAVLTGAFNWLRVKPSLGDAASTGRVRRSAAVEVGIGVLVILVTAVLVATPTPMDEM